VNVILGTNRFVDCETIIQVGGQPLLRVDDDPLRLTVVTPPNLPSGRHVRVVNNIVDAAVSASFGPVKVVSTERTVSLLWETFLLVAVTAIEEGLVNVHIDFRPVGLNMFDDSTGLHLGEMHFAQSTFAGTPTAFSFG
jgi:hypothetical protein